MHPRTRKFCRLAAFAALCLLAGGRLHADEIFFNLDSLFNARILVDDSDKASGKGFGGDLNAKCLKPSVTPDGIMQSYNNIDFRVGAFSRDNAILLPLGGRVEIPLPGQPRLTTLSFLYTAYRYLDGKGAGNVVVTYADGGTQEFPWEDPGMSGNGRPGVFQTSVSIAGYFESFLAKENRNAANIRFYNRVLNGLDPERPVAKLSIDTKGFRDPGNDAEWAIFAVTGNGRVGEATPLAEVNSGKRPYELDWAGRTEDEHTPTVDFQDVSGWKAACPTAKAFFQSSTEKPLFLPKSARLEIRSESMGTVTLRPPAPVPLPPEFNAVSLWVYGDGLMISPELSPEKKLQVKALFKNPSGKTVEVPFLQIRHGEWFKLHHQFSGDELKQLGAGSTFVGFDVTGFGDKEDRVIYLSNLAAFKDSFSPLNFKPQPKRGIAPLPGATEGVNTGEGKLPFPTREQTILPLNLSKDFTNTATLDGVKKGFRQKILALFKGETRGNESKDGRAVFTYEGKDAKISYVYKPQKGDFGDIEGTITYPDGTALTFQPSVGGGLRFGEASSVASAARLTGMTMKDGLLTANWEMTVDGAPVPVTYRLRIWQKSLVLDVLCEGGKVSRVTYGHTSGLRNPRLVTTPYYTYDIYSKDRPAVVVSGDEKQPLFFAAHTDWYLSNGSELYAINSVKNGEVTGNGGINYRAMTNGRRQNCAERLFLTASPVYDEVLPTVANPPSPYKSIGYNAMWRSFGSPQSRFHHARYLYRYWRQGIKEQIVTDHEGLFRDREESFTFRTKTAPLKGGDEGAKWISDYLRNTLGYVYGPYCQFTDIGTVNQFFKLDHVVRTPDNQLQHGWFRMYQPKPVWAQEEAEGIAIKLKGKFGYTDSYCDVHTAFAPWQIVDYDSRVPGAATFAQTFYSYGQIFLKQKAAWDGPVYSEGNYHSFYAGLTDGDYAQDKGYRLAYNPWLVNFDLRNMHNLNANYGMGDMYMFMWESGFDFKKDKAAGSFALDRLIAATLAYGHAAIMPASVGLNIAAPRTHFMAVPITRLYGLSPVADIEYASENGGWKSASSALLDGSYANSQLRVRYENGTTVVANGSPTDTFLKVTEGNRTLELPQNGYSAWSADGRTEVLSSLDEYGNRFDYAVTPDHIYIDGRGKPVRRRLAAANGPAVLRILGNGEFEYIPLNLEFEGDYLQRGESVMAGFAIQADSVTALDYEMKALPDKVEALVSRGLTWIMPVKGAHSYMIKGRLTPPESRITSDSPYVFPGQTVSIQGKNGQVGQLKIPSIAETGRQIWRQFGDQWIDFTIIEPFQFQKCIKDGKLLLDVKSLLPRPADVVVEANGVKQTVTIAPQTTRSVTYDLPQQPGESTWTLKAESGDFKTTSSLVIQTTNAPVTYAALTDRGIDFGVSLRNGVQPNKAASGADVAEQNSLTAKESVDVGGSGASMTPVTGNCGGVSKRAIALQVPWKGDTGYVFIAYPNIRLPAGSEPILKTSFGKRDGSNPGDGMLYRVILIDESGKETTLGETWVKKHEWVDFNADLKPWAGQKVTLKFICDAGGDADGDWGAVALPVITGSRSEIQQTIK